MDIPKPIIRTIDILCLNGECYIKIIEEKDEASRTWYDKLYLLFYQNINIIILILGILLVCSMIYVIYNSSIPNTKAVKYIQIQIGGDDEEDNVKPEKQKKKGVISSFTKGVKTGTMGVSSKVGAKVKQGAVAAKDAAKKKLKAAPGKLVQGVKDNAKSFYTIVFSAAIVLAVGFFFIPTLCMIIIGILTYQLTKNQVVSMFTA
jgi:hypothetical protein